ncbi:MAG: 4'-phosphopantetheinyl transferase family protein [Flavobacterium sp.]
MPLIIQKTINFETKLLVWQITESLDFLIQNTILCNNSKLRLQNMKSESHKKGFLAVRMLLQYIGYTDNDLYYNQEGKPLLIDQNNISISHSFEYSCIIISKKNIGIDIEKHKDLIKKIDYKFAINEINFLKKNSDDYIKYLTIIWGVKESIFKIINKPGISFNDHIWVDSFILENCKGNVTLNFKEINSIFEFNFISLPNYSLVYIIK